MFNIPDRSGITRNTSRTEDSEDIDIGWADGTLSDGRPYRAECWATDQITVLTFFFSTAQIEAYTDAQFIQLLEDEGLIEFFGDSKYDYEVAIKNGMDFIYLYELSDIDDHKAWVYANNIESHKNFDEIC